MFLLVQYGIQKNCIQRYNFFPLVREEEEKERGGERKREEKRGGERRKPSLYSPIKSVSFTERLEKRWSMQWQGPVGRKRCWLPAATS